MDLTSATDYIPFGGEAERRGTELDKATDEFITETRGCRALQIPAGQTQLTAMEYVAYLGIDLHLEPELAWIAREMLAAPMPPNAQMKVSQAGVVYFHDEYNDFYTIEHPHTQRYLKVLERQRVDRLALRTKPSVNGLLFSQPDMIFHKQFRNLQIPCQSCGVMQSTVKCDQCLMSFCQACADALHKKSLGPRKNHTFLTTAFGSLCYTCMKKKPQVFCANCNEYSCFKCYNDMHQKGNRQHHKAMQVKASDGEIIEPEKRCDECQNNPAAFACDFCLDNFCVSCFWKCHFNGNRRKHTASKVCVVPLCNQCQSIRATIFCEQCQELMCTECFTLMHHKGNRMLHLFMDATDLLVLLERLDPTFQEHMRRTRPRVLKLITYMQGWSKLKQIKDIRNKKDELVTQIQRRWRGAQQRKKLLGMLHMHKWRRRQINAHFLPKSSQERHAVKQKVSAMLAAKEVTQKAANTQLRELKETIMHTSKADPNEPPRFETLQRLGLEEKDIPAEPPAPPPLNTTAASQFGTLALAGTTEESIPAGYTTYADSRFGGNTAPITASIADRGVDLSLQDSRKRNESRLRTMTGLDK